ncbi:MAG: hypothetical protein JWN89_505 [Parcubacteria group bacterium]|nr:hypothetical protein [Parcubacteria group bacterium]
MTENLAAVGRIRDGRVDTGVQIYNNEKMVSAELVRRALTNAGFGLDRAQMHKQQKEGATTKFVVTLAYSPAGTPIAELSRATTEALRDLASTPWFCHIWLNPNGVLTINFVGVQQGSPKQNVTVRDDVLGIVPAGFEGPVTDGVRLDEIKLVLVKFFFTNEKRVPAGIERIDRPADAEMDSRHAAAVQ